ncbi:MAG: type II secretion system protein [Gudongella sp.]|jgi:prepilin-type N-terminal cleavage/methylation domain-containing protein|nr:type II secretion system protein [Gudongella sp.]
MNNNKGFTLIEVIVSLAVLGIISVSFLGALTGHYSYLNSTKRITEDVFLAQQAIELAIDEAKGDEAGLTEKEKSLFASGLGGGGIKVKYYEISSEYDNREYYTLVSTLKTDPLELVELEYLNLYLRQGTNNVDYAYGLGDFNLLGNFNNKVEYKWDHLLNQSEWFVSSSEFNMPLPKSSSFDVNDGDNSYYFPIFPRDFELIENKTINKFGTSETKASNIGDYAGRHVVFAVTPAAKSGKLGVQLFSKPLFISGLPVIENLIAHLDANYIDMLDNTEANQSNKTVIKWNDISSIIGKTTINESASNSTASDRPVVMRTEVGYGYVGQFVRFDTGKTLSLTGQGTSGKKITVISVIYNRTEGQTLYLKNGSQSFNASIP